MSTEDHHQLDSPPPPIQSPDLRRNQNDQPPPTPAMPMPKPTGPTYLPDEPNRRGLCASTTIVVLLVCFLIPVPWLVFRPTKPQFGVVSAALYSLNVTAPPLVTTSMQFTIVITNPNHWFGIYFDTLNAYVSYRSHPITTPVAIPELYMEEHSSVSVSPMIGGSPVQVSRDVPNGLAMDEAYGVVGVSVIMQGRLRWKTGAIRTGHYGIFVKCDVVMCFKKGVSGQVPLTGAPVWHVDV